MGLKDYVTHIVLRLCGQKFQVGHVNFHVRVGALTAPCWRFGSWDVARRWVTSASRLEGPLVPLFVGSPCPSSWNLYALWVLTVLVVLNARARARTHTHTQIFYAHFICYVLHHFYHACWRKFVTVTRTCSSFRASCFYFKDYKATFMEQRETRSHSDAFKMKETPAISSYIGI
jgi:hypothetical protein